MLFKKIVCVLLFCFLSGSLLAERQKQPLFEGSSLLAEVSSDGLKLITQYGLDIDRELFTHQIKPWLAQYPQPSADQLAEIVMRAKVRFRERGSVLKLTATYASPLKPFIAYKADIQTGRSIMNLIVSVPKALKGEGLTLVINDAKYALTNPEVNHLGSLSWTQVMLPFDSQISKAIAMQLNQKNIAQVSVSDGRNSVSFRVTADMQQNLKDALTLSTLLH